MNSDVLFDAIKDCKLEMISFDKQMMDLYEQSVNYCAPSVEEMIRDSLRIDENEDARGRTKKKEGTI